MADSIEPKVNLPVAVIALLLIVPIVLLGSWSWWLIWNWYAPVVHPSLPHATFHQMLAVRVLWSTCKSAPSTTNKSIRRVIVESISHILCELFFFWLIYRLVLV